MIWQSCSGSAVSSYSYSSLSGCGHMLCSSLVLTTLGFNAEDVYKQETGNCVLCCHETLYGCIYFVPV